MKQNMNKKMDHDLALRILNRFVDDVCVGADFDMCGPNDTRAIMREWWNKNRFKYTIAKPTTNRVLVMARQMRREHVAKSGGGLLSSGYDDGILVGIDRIIGLIERTGYSPKCGASKLDDLYQEILEREKHLKSQPKTPETDARILEIELCILRVQQMLIDDVKRKNKPETNK